jgi:hypothetical protein
VVSFAPRYRFLLEHTSGYAGEGASYIIKGLQPTARSLRSCLTSASGSGSGLAFGEQPTRLRIL